MRTQALYIEDRKLWEDVGPVVAKINVNLPISAIDVVIQATNGATMNQGNPLRTDVDRVELMNGSDRLHSLSLVQGIIQHAHEKGRYPAHMLNEGAAAVQQEGYRISFGRYLGDPEYWLDPTAFSNLQYRLTGDLTISATAGFATGTRYLTLIAHVMTDSPLAHSGFFMTKEMNQWTTVASGDRRTDLPDDFPWRMLGFRAAETGTPFDTDITNLKLTQGKDSFVTFDLRAVSLRDIMEEIHGETEITQTVFRTDADTPSCGLAYPRTFSVDALNDLDIASVDARTVDQLTIQLLSLTAVPAIAKSGTDQNIVMNARGVMPYFGLVWPFGDKDDADQWLRGDAIRSQELVATQGGAGAAASTWLQQVRGV